MKPHHSTQLLNMMRRRVAKHTSQICLQSSMKMTAPGPLKAEAKNPSCSLAKGREKEPQGITVIRTKFRSHRADLKRKLGETNHYFYEAKASSQHPSRCQRGSTINSRSTALKVLRTSPFAPHKKWSQGSDPLPPPFPHQECLLKVGSIFHKVLEILQCLNSHLALQDQGGT